MDATYGSLYRNIYENHWWWRAREAYIVSWLTAICPAGGFGPILDVGCGDGLFFEQLSRFGTPEGVETDERLVTARDSRRGRIHVRPFDVSFKPEHRFGLIVMLDVLEHMDDPAAALRHAISLLAANGRIVITVPAFMALWTRHDELNEHRLRYTKASLRKLGDEAGLRIDEMRYFFHWTHPAKLLVRLKEFVLRSRPAPPAIPPKWINRGFYWMSRFEAGAIGWMRPPLGSSVLAIGRARA